MLLKINVLFAAAISLFAADSVLGLEVALVSLPFEDELKLVTTCKKFSNLAEQVWQLEYRRKFVLGAGPEPQCWREAYKAKVLARNIEYLLEHGALIDDKEGRYLVGADLSGKFLLGYDLRNADLSDGMLQATTFYLCKLGRAKFTRANLQRAQFIHVDVSKISFKDARMDGARLHVGDAFYNAKGTKRLRALRWLKRQAARWEQNNPPHMALYFSGQTKSPADVFSREQRRERVGARIDLYREDLSGFNLADEDFSQADLCEANMSWTNLKKANLRDADLSNTVLQGSQLDDADFRGAYYVVGAERKPVTLKYLKEQGALWKKHRVPHAPAGLEDEPEESCFLS